MNVELTHPWTWKKIPLWIRNWVQFYVPMDPSDKFAFWFGGSKEKQSWCHNLNGIEMHGSGNDMRMICAYAFSLKNVAGYEVIWRVSEESWNISNRSSHEVQFDGCSWQMCAAANVQLCWLVAHCKWYNLGCLDGWLHTPLQIWYNPTVAEQYKGSGTVSVFSSSRFPSILFLQLVAIIIIFSLIILLTFKFHIVSVSSILLPLKSALQMISAFCL